MLNSFSSNSSHKISIEEKIMIERRNIITRDMKYIIERVESGSRNLEETEEQWEKKKIEYVVSLDSITVNRNFPSDRFDIRIKNNKYNEEIDTLRIFDSGIRKRILKNIEENIQKGKTIQVSGLSGLGKSYTLIDYVIKQRIKLKNQLNENDTSQKFIPLYFYFNSKNENEFMEYFKFELFYSLYPFFKDECTKYISNSEVDIKKETLFNLVLKLFITTSPKEIQDLLKKEEVFKKILYILQNEFNAKLVVIIDQINEIRGKDDDFPYMKFIYDLVFENCSKLALIQCASNNNEYTRENFKLYLEKTNPGNLEV